MPAPVAAQIKPSALAGLAGAELEPSEVSGLADVLANLFAEVLASQRAFREDYARWKTLGFLPRDF